jgi:hypothetical protein
MCFLAYERVPATVLPFIEHVPRPRASLGDERIRHRVLPEPPHIAQKDGMLQRASPGSCCSPDVVLVEHILLTFLVLHALSLLRQISLLSSYSSRCSVLISKLLQLSWSAASVLFSLLTNSCSEGVCCYVCKSCVIFLLIYRRFIFQFGKEIHLYKEVHSSSGDQHLLWLVPITSFF